MSRLRERIAAHFERDMQETEIVVPYALSRLVAEAHASTRVLKESHEEDGTHLRLRASAEILGRLSEAARRPGK